MARTTQPMTRFVTACWHIGPEGGASASPVGVTAVITDGSGDTTNQTRLYNEIICSLML